ncbi:MAG: hypothetical protein EBT03_12725 [Betaproteobacteria bacterium]|nr:hypothetical protein [Betaproteobacteria bacterium]NCA17882.1 hypothetical protein [Betaproteobacteria bacterium]
MAKLSRTRGNTYEREVCAELSAVMGQKVVRILGQARDGGGDIFTPPFLWECKRRRNFAGYTFMEQAVISAEAQGAIPIVAIRADGQESLVMMRMKDALPLIQGEIVGNVPECDGN